MNKVNIVGSHPLFLEEVADNGATISADTYKHRLMLLAERKLNDTSVVSEGLTIEFAFPWSGMKWLADGRTLPPSEGDIWGIFMGRYEKLHINGTETSVGWSLDTVGTDDNHRPELFTKVKFSQDLLDIVNPL